MNKLYDLELTVMMIEIDKFLDDLFVFTGFYESEKLTIRQFKKRLLSDYIKRFEA